MSAAGAWLSTLRVRTLPAAAAPVLVGTAFAWRHAAFDATLAAATLLCALLIQVGTNLANDYYDHRKGADTPDRAGPRRASASGLLPPRQVRNAAFLAFGAAALLGAWLAWLGGWPILAIGTAALLSGLLYTAGPKPLGYAGLGDLFVLAFFGPVAVMGTAYLQLHAAGQGFGVPAYWMPTLFMGIALGCLATAILVVNNLRDAETDARAGKRTLAVRLGRRFAKAEYVTLVALAFLLAAMAYQRHGQWQLLLPLPAALLALPPLRLVLRDPVDRARLNPALGQTGLLLLAYALLQATGLVLLR